MFGHTTDKFYTIHYVRTQSTPLTKIVTVEFLYTIQMHTHNRWHSSLST